MKPPLPPLISKSVLSFYPIVFPLMCNTLVSKSQAGVISEQGGPAGVCLFFFWCLFPWHSVIDSGAML